MAKFTSQEVELARKLKGLGLAWTPQVSHYVWDETGIINCPSPFHDMVYYILDLKHFLRRAGTIERLQDELCWLPSWEQARELLREHGVSDEAVARRLDERQALLKGEERLCLYQLLEEALVAGKQLAEAAGSVS
ncbi:MAG: hypothetical protein ACKO9H_00670 [Planctomycetota bacterium]